VSDQVAKILDAWRAEFPALDVTPVAVCARITRIERHKRHALGQLYRRHGIDSGEFDVLAALRRSGPADRLSPTALYRLGCTAEFGFYEQLRQELGVLLATQPWRRSSTRSCSASSTGSAARRAR